MRPLKADRWTAAETQACRKAVAPHLDADDGGWVLDLCFEECSGFWGLDAALARLPAETIRMRLQRELASAESRRVAKAIRLTLRAKHLPNRGAILERLCQVSWRDGSLRREALHAKSLYDKWQEAPPPDWRRRR